MATLICDVCLFQVSNSSTVFPTLVYSMWFWVKRDDEIWFTLSCIVRLLQVLDSSHSHKVSRKAEEVFRRVGLGLQGNACVTPQILLVFIHGLASESLPLLKEKKPRYAPYSTLFSSPILTDHTLRIGQKE